LACACRREIGRTDAVRLQHEFASDFDGDNHAVEIDSLAAEKPAYVHRTETGKEIGDRVIVHAPSCQPWERLS
jgi:hypothetical protein